MDARTTRFLEVSAELTGFCRVELAGTGMTASYLAALDELLPTGLVDRLLAAWSSADGRAVLDDPELGPVTRNVILLWYRGAWSALRQDWRTAYGVSSHDSDRVVSAAAYRAGLQWAAAGAHPAGAAPQGYGAWAAPPAGGA